MYICRAFIKYDYSNFSLEILEYCEVSQLLIREKHYWDKYTPEYNIAKEPGAPMSGRTHSDETKQIMSDIHKKIDHSGRYKTGHKHSDETKKIMSDNKKGENHPMYGKNHTEETKKIMSDAIKGKTLSDETKNKISDAQLNSQAIEVTDITNNTTTSYDSMGEVARVLNINHSVITKYFSRNQKKPYKGRYTFQKI